MFHFHIVIALLEFLFICVFIGSEDLWEAARELLNKNPLEYLQFSQDFMPYIFQEFLKLCIKCFSF